MNEVRAKLTVYVYGDNDECVDSAIDDLLAVESDLATIVFVGEDRESL